jgi:NTE family protein
LFAEGAPPYHRSDSHGTRSEADWRDGGGDARHGKGRSSTMARKLLLVLAAAALAACSAAPETEPVTRLAASADSERISEGGYRLTELASNGSANELLVLMASSGGGKRSSAFSYGVLRGLRDFQITYDGRSRRLLDELDTIAAVSGGSFPAAYYGLYRDKLFTDFETDFLKQDIEAYIWGIYMFPWKWEWWLNPYYGTGDEMATVYDKLMFHGATYADLQQKGKPFISINATDINYGTVFSFVQDQFDYICSDLTRYPVANAVAASNSFPILFTPITLENHADKCDGRTPAWIQRLAEGKSSTRQRYLAENAKLYLDPKKTKYVHLMDGGIADNLALRHMIDNVLIHADEDDFIKFVGFDKIRRIVLISADGQGSRDSSWPQQRNVSSLGQVFSAVSGSQIDRYNFETLLLVDQELKHLVDSLKRVRCGEAPMINGHACDDVQGFFAHLSLAGIEDEEEREILQAIPTGLTIPDEDVDKLFEAGAAAIGNSKELEDFRKSLGVEAAAP